MRILPATPEGIETALAALVDGKTVMHATETCYGFACDLSNPKAVERLFTIKQRSFEQPVSALFPSIEEAKKYVEWNDRAEKLAQEFLPGRLMIVLLMSKKSSPRSLPHTRFTISRSHHSPLTIPHPRRSCLLPPPSPLNLSPASVAPSAPLPPIFMESRVHTPSKRSWNNTKMRL